MFDISEYKEYMVANQDFIVYLKDKNSICYDRLTDILKVLGYIDFMFDQYGTLGEDEEHFEVFYDTGFYFFFNQFEQIKLYYNNYFNKNYDEFKKYEPLINYALYIDDLKDTIREEDLLNDKIVEATSLASDKIEEILEKKLNYEDSIFEELNAIISSSIVFKRRIFTTTEAFERIVEELML